MFRDLYDYKAGDWSGPSYYTPPNSSVCAVRVELGVEQRGGEMVDLDRNSGKGLDLERRQCKRERETVQGLAGEWG